MLFLIAGASRAQLNRLDSVVGSTIHGMLGSALDVRTSLDTSLHLLMPFVPINGSTRELHVDRVEAILDTSRSPSVMNVSVSGEIVGVPREQRQWTLSVPVTGSSETLAAETNRSRFVQLKAQPKEEGSLWSSVFEPALVIIGAGAIVALFFLIRS